MRLIALGLLAIALQAADVDVYSPQDLQAMSGKLAAKKQPFASESLKRYGNHYTMLAFREATGSSEVHQHEADILYAVEGDATILTGGKLVNERTDKPGELRGTSIQGGERHAFAKGSVIHIPAGVPHQVLIEKGKPFTYFVVKVTEQ